MTFAADTEARHVVALRIAVDPIRDPSRGLPTHSPDLATALLRGARLSSAAIVTGYMTGDRDETRVRVCHSSLFGEEEMRGIPAGRSAGLRESTVLRWLGHELAESEHPLLVTFGGHSFDLPYLLFRSIAHDISIPPLMFQIGHRLKYFDQHDPGWHVDLRCALNIQRVGNAIGLREVLDALAQDDSELGSLVGSSLASECMSLFYLFTKYVGARGMSAASDRVQAFADLRSLNGRS